MNDFMMSGARCALLTPHVETMSLLQTSGHDTKIRRSCSAQVEAISLLHSIGNDSKTKRSYSYSAGDQTTPDTRRISAVKEVGS